MSTTASLTERTVGDNRWFAETGDIAFPNRSYSVQPEVLPDEASVGRAMLAELEAVAQAKPASEPVSIALLGGRGAQALHQLLGEYARQGDPTGLLARLHVFTQDALAPLPMGNAFSFVRDFERLLGTAFWEQIRSFTPFYTEVQTVEEMATHVEAYLSRLHAVGGLDIFFLGHGPEPEDASHLAYIKPGAGATWRDWAGIIPISESIREHHIAKFKAGGVVAEANEEDTCRHATHILTLGPAAILNAKRVVQSVVDAETAPAKKRTYRKVVETVFSNDPVECAEQVNQNPGLWVRFHPKVRSLILPNVYS
jgi:6-phosphogluconolactonase/glucosamine-6-phosphate isomerase/deaminase